MKGRTPELTNASEGARELRPRTSFHGSRRCREVGTAPLTVRCMSVDWALLPSRCCSPRRQGKRHPPGAMQRQPCPSPQSGVSGGERDPVPGPTLHPGSTPVPPEDPHGDLSQTSSPRLWSHSSPSDPFRTLALASLGLRAEEIKTEEGKTDLSQAFKLPQLFGRRQRAPGLGAQRLPHGPVPPPHPRLRQSAEQGAQRAGLKLPHCTDARPGTGLVPSA